MIILACGICGGAGTTDATVSHPPEYYASTPCKTCVGTGWLLVRSQEMRLYGGAVDGACLEYLGNEEAPDKFILDLIDGRTYEYVDDRKFDLIYEYHLETVRAN